ncbi:unnamed protein product [Paramecium octaurelia]|uniref:Uncharacterized protein n=1 Tax=Paramecium octaurelia TaxID=43137 RepID=A0A8S1SYX3_PAROT|nr:unnamed protein product [Paramecium octaurelia]
MIITISKTICLELDEIDQNLYLINLVNEICFDKF